MESKECACKTAAGNGGYVDLIRTFGQTKENLIPALHTIQDKLGYLPGAAMQELSDWLGVPISDVYGTATFYTLFSTEPKGRYVIRLCDSPPCHLEGSKSIKSAIQSAIGVPPGETTEDGDFTFEIVSCLGLCGVAPAIMINDDVYGNLAPEMIGGIIDKYRAKEA